MAAPVKPVSKTDGLLLNCSGGLRPPEKRRSSQGSAFSFTGSDAQSLSAVADGVRGIFTLPNYAPAPSDFSIRHNPNDDLAITSGSSGIIHMHLFLFLALSFLPITQHSLEYEQ
jgi:hypothetical protein